MFGDLWVTLRSQSDHSHYQSYAAVKPFWLTLDELKGAIQRKAAYRGMYAEFEER